MKSNILLFVSAAAILLYFLVTAVLRPKEDGVPVEERSIVAAVNDISLLLEAYLSEHGSYPESLDDLAIVEFQSGVSTSYLHSFSYSYISTTNGNAHSQSYTLERKGVGVRVPGNDELGSSLHNKQKNKIEIVE